MNGIKQRNNVSTVWIRIPVNHLSNKLTALNQLRAVQRDKNVINNTL